MAKLYLRDILRDIPFEDLPAKWRMFDLVHFSETKKLYDFQQEALKNALKALWLYFKDKKADKKALYDQYGIGKTLDYDLTAKKKKNSGKHLSDYIKYFLEYPEDYSITDGKISFAYFINRMSFWMATGSGKSLIIVKLIQFLGQLIAEKELPEGDILFLTHRDDLLKQFENHVRDFNSSPNNTKIKLESLKDYERVKRELALPFYNGITVFSYRADLISDEQKEKIVDFRDYDNGGKWYIFLDEAHKGDKEESKRQILYSILSRKGFLFNFSATFTDPRDFATCVFEFNLSKFVEQGYGKHICISDADIRALTEKDDFSNIQKQKIILKILLLLTYIHKHFEEIRRIHSSLYHRPLLLTLANSVDITDSDLELFFKELEKVATGRFRKYLLIRAKKELIMHFSNNTKCQFEEIDCLLDTKLISRLRYKDILEAVFNAKTPGKIEVLMIPGNKNELIFKLVTTEKPFALIKIGDISGWLKSKLRGYTFNLSYENESHFSRINHDDSDIKILMGSRAFYEGWDSNRPNIVLFINIGKQKESKKFVLQSIGRGVRIEPIKNKRRRLQNLFNAKEVEAKLFHRVRNLIFPIETLFVFGTKVQNLIEIVKTLQEEKQEKDLGQAFIVNPEVEAKNLLLLVPVYRVSKRILADEHDPQKYPMSREDLNLTKQYLEFIGDRVCLAKYDCEVSVLKKAKESFLSTDQYYDFDDSNILLEPETTLGRIFDHFAIKSEDLDTFKQLENEIVHFRKIRVSDEQRYKEIVEKVERVKKYPEKAEMERKIDEEFERSKDREKYKKAIKQLELEFPSEIQYDKLKIKYLANHYYLPVILSEDQKIDYINHIITTESERKFIEQLEDYLKRDGNIFSQLDWWMFSKIDQSLDEVYIPYYNPKENKIARFKPDFIFWGQICRLYLVLFVDPKGTEYTDAYRKIDGYSKLFEVLQDGQIISKDFSYNGLTIKTKLLFWAKRGIASVPDKYKKYWFDNFDDFADKIVELKKNIVQL